MQVLAVVDVRDQEAPVEELVMQAGQRLPVVLGVTEGRAGVGRDRQVEPGLEALRERAIVGLAAIGADAVRAGAEDQRRARARLGQRRPVADRAPVVVQRVELQAGLEGAGEAVAEGPALARALRVDVRDRAEGRDPARLLGRFAGPTDRQALAGSLRSARDEAGELRLLDLLGRERLLQGEERAEEERGEHLDEARTRAAPVNRLPGRGGAPPAQRPRAVPRARTGTGRAPARAPGRRG